MLYHSCNSAFYDPFDCQRWNMKCQIGAILPFITLLITKDEVWSAELVLAILFLCSFSHIFLNLSAFLTSFLPIGSNTPKHNFLFSFLYIFYFGILPNLYLIFQSCLPRTLFHIVTTLGYFRILLHRLLLSITSNPVFC
jgi:hypothetical protein